MSWNEPPDNKDPWSKKGGGEPPDIDEFIRKMQQSLSGFFGNKSSKGNGSENKHGVSPVFALLLFALLTVWFTFDSFYAIDEQERGVVLRFGKHVADLQPGLSWRFPRPIERVIKVNVGQVRSMKHKANMLTQDENIVDVEVAVQWKIGNPVKFLFNLYAPAATLRQVTESVVREVVGKRKLDFILTEGRSAVAQRQEVLIQEVMDLYQSGILIAKVEMQSAKPPEQVKAAFDDAIKAREDEQRSVNQAEAYRNDVIPRARGAAARLREEANAYKAKVISKAEGEASRFEQLLAEYQRAPEVTRQRLYIDAIEEVLSNSAKILVDSENANSLMYLPIDKLLQREISGKESSVSKQFGSEMPNRQDPITGQIDKRGRGGR